MKGAFRDGKGRVGRPFRITGEINTKSVSPYLHSAVGNENFCSTKLTLNTLCPVLLKFQASTYHKVVRQLDRIQRRATGMVQVPKAKYQMREELGLLW